MTGLVGKRGMADLNKRMNEHSSSSGMSSFGRRILEKYGWTEGKGLGKNEDGMVSHVKVKQREDSAGLGIEEHDRKKVTENWWFNCFEKALTNVKSAVDVDEGGKKKKKRKKKGTKEASGGGHGEVEDGVHEGPTYEELFKATGGRRMGMRARASQKAKWERTEEGQVSWQQDGKKETASVCTSVRIEMDRVVELTDPPAEGKKKKEKKDKKKRRRDEEEEEAVTPLEGEVVAGGEQTSEKEKKKKGKKKSRDADIEGVEEEEEAGVEAANIRKKKKRKFSAMEEEEEVAQDEKRKTKKDKKKKKKQKEEKVVVGDQKKEKKGKRKKE